MRIRLAITFVLTCTAAIAQPAPQRGMQHPAPTAANVQNGNYYALVIGIDDYRAPLPKLKTAVNDAQAIDKVLREKYGFKVKLLLNANATRDNILDAVTQYRNTLTENDNLLIYYAGHGYSDHDAEKAYWLPIDADSTSSSHRISADDLTVGIKVQRARHVLIVSDSCYSGGLSRDADAPAQGDGQQAFLNRMLAGRSRTLMASGGDEPVSDKGADGHSVFAYAVLRALDKADVPMFTAAELFYASVQKQVAGRSEQLPQYSVIRNSSHTDGDFVFSRIPEPNAVRAEAKPVTTPLAVPAAPDTGASGSDKAGSIPRTEVTGSSNAADAYLRGKALYGRRQYSEAKPLLDSACDAGNPQGCYFLSLMYRVGDGVFKDEKHADVLARKTVPLARAACDNGDAEACFTLGNLYVRDLEVKKDTKQAAALFRRACEAKLANACSSLGTLYMQGDGVPRDAASAVALYNDGCDEGSGSACYQLARSYRDGTGVAKDSAKSESLYRKACDRGSSMACLQLGYQFEAGRGVAKDAAQADVFYRKACDLDSAYECYTLGTAYEKKDRAQAIEFYRKGCDLKNEDACKALNRLKP